MVNLKGILCYKFYIVYRAVSGNLWRHCLHTMDQNCCLIGKLISFTFTLELSFLHITLHFILCVQFQVNTHTFQNLFFICDICSVLEVVNLLTLL